MLATMLYAFLVLAEGFMLEKALGRRGKFWRVIAYTY